MRAAAAVADAPTSTDADDDAVERVLAHLVQAGALAPESLVRARAVARHGAEPIVLVLPRLGLVSDRELAAAFAAVLGVPTAAADAFPDEPVLPDRLHARFLRHVAALPLAVHGGTLLLAMADPLDEATRHAVAVATGLAVAPRCSARGEIEAAIDRLYANPATAQAGGADAAGVDDDIARLRDMASEAPIIRLANALIDRAAATGASDIHITPLAGKLSIRLRIDGALRETEAPPRGQHAALLSRLKLMAGLDIAERRLPQDGRIRVVHAGRELDLRVATTPSLHGESMVIRLLNREAAALDLDRLGLPAEPLARLRRLLAAPNGLVLVTGPTGSGKTTTLYAALASLNRTDAKLMSVEDPVEYHLEGMVQTQAQPGIGLDFARALRAILRHDPNIVLVGEIRDRETAEIAMRAALTGHLVLSTLHTNSAAASIPRLLDMGVADHLIAATLQGVVAQRLVRTLCTACRGAGCTTCHGTGLRGRAALIEVMPTSPAIRALVMARADAQCIHAQAIAEGMRPLADDGADRVAAGLTTAAEVARETRDD
jgi:general secretion pathway protein E